jgi:hypothetical protein
LGVKKGDFHHINRVTGITVLLHLLSQTLGGACKSLQKYSDLPEQNLGCTILTPTFAKKASFLFELAKPLSITANENGHLAIC